MSVVDAPHLAKVIINRSALDAVTANDMRALSCPYGRHPVSPLSSAKIAVPSPYLMVPVDCGLILAHQQPTQSLTAVARQFQNEHDGVAVESGPVRPAFV